MKKEIKFDPYFQYPEGSQLFDVRYYRKPKECFEVIYWSPVTQRLEVNYEKPIIDIWFLKKEYRGDERSKFQRAWIEQDKCYCVHCLPSQVAKKIYEHAGDAVYYDHRKNKTQYTYAQIYEQIQEDPSYTKNKLTKLMCENPWVFKGDFIPEVYYKLKWVQEHGDEFNIGCVTSAFLDIEVDTIDRPIDLDDYHNAPQPVNAVTLILPAQKICAVFVLGPRPKDKIDEKFHKLLSEQEAEFNWLTQNQRKFIEMIKFDDEDNKKWISDYDVRLHIFDFDKEIEMIATIFAYINKYRPMFCLSWNAPFDDNYLWNRIRELGYDPEQIIIPEEILTNKIYFQEDNSDTYSMKTDGCFWHTSTFTVYMCQMRLYAQIRKAEKEMPSYALTYIGGEVVKIHKLSDTKSGTFREFPYTDFLKFILYNVRDVVVQLAIESIVTDCQSLVSRCYEFATPYSKATKETVIVRGSRELDFETQGIIQGCFQVVNPDIDTHYEGAYVAPTELNMPTGQILNGKMINNIIYAVMDADAKAYYPSTKMGDNLDAETVDYKCDVSNDVFINKICMNRSYNQTYTWKDSDGGIHQKDMTTPIFNSYKNGNIQGVTFNWFNIPSVTDYFRYLDMVYGYNK